MSVEKVKNCRTLSPIVLTVLAAVSVPAHGQYVNSYVEVDANTYNTAMGTGALPSDGGSVNTASGFAALYSNTTGSANTAIGADALSSNTTGQRNTASGFNALYSNTTGSFNTASGSYALEYNTTGGSNTASGYVALNNNSTGSANTASGANALEYNTTGSSNTASGYQALNDNTTGSENTASGYQALNDNTTGNDNTASGGNALTNNTTGSSNTASGSSALFSNTTGNYNTASGLDALFSNTTGANNTAVGTSALTNSTTGNGNIALGYEAGSNLTTGSNDIYIGTLGGSAGESNYIRIGTEGTQQAAFMAGVYGTSISGGAEVVINSKGQLGIKTSSRRFKDNIQAMGESSKRLYRLKPVTFRYKEPETNGKRPVQYGLIAEEVDKTYPELVIRDDSGKIQGVRYDELAPMLLNEVQKQQNRIAAQAAELTQLNEHVAKLERLTQSLQATIVQQRNPDSLLASR